MAKKREPRQELLKKRFMRSCGWCGNKIEKNQPVYGGGVKLRLGIDLTAMEGEVLELFVETMQRKVLVAVATRNSEAKKQGEDLLFMTCSKPCAEQCREALGRDIKLGNDRGSPGAR